MLLVMAGLRLKPTGLLYLQQYVFKRHKVQAVLKQALQDRMEGQQYDPVKAAQVGTSKGCQQWRLVGRCCELMFCSASGTMCGCSMQSN